MRLFLFLLFVCPSAFAAYTEMVIEGIKQSNGVWTTAGVADSMGFVRTTGSLVVAGESVSTSVALKASQTAASTLLKNTARSLGPYGIAAYGAYEVYDYFATDNNLQACTAAPDSGWCNKPDLTNYDASYTYGSYWKACSGTCNTGSTKSDACLAWVNANPSYSVGEVLSDRCTIKFRSNGGDAGYLPLTIALCSGATSPLSCVQQEDPNRPQAIPMSQADWDALPLFDWNTLNDGFQKIPSLHDNGLPLESTSFKPFSEWLGSPYFKDGNWWRDRVDISPCPTSSQPNRVCVDIGPQKFEGATDPEILPPQAIETPTGTTPKEKPSFCKENPQSIACVELGELEEEEITPDERPFNITPESPWGQGTASCPSPETQTLRTGAMVTFSYQPTCDFFSSIRPAVIAVAFLAALYIALGIPAGKGD